MNIFLTGSSGFIGRNIIKNSSLYKEIKIFANSKKKISTKNNIKIINKNLNKISYLDLQKIDVIIHSASVGVKNNDIQIKKSIKFNFYESLLFFKKAIKAGCKNWIILGSSSEYGNSLLKKRKINKNTELVPADNYSLSKCLLFYALSSIAKVYDINLVYLRIFPTYGLNEKSHRLIPQMKKSIRLNKKFVLKNPNASIDYSNVDEISKKILSICRYMIKKNNIVEIWHLASGKYEYLKSFAYRHWIKIGGKKINFKIKNEKINIYHHISDKNSIWR